MITIGIDPHTRSLTAAALDPHSRLLSQLRVPTTGQAAQQVLTWAAAWPERRWAVEGATGLGRGIAQLLVAAGEPVLDVPAKLAARARMLGPAAPQDRPGRRRLGRDRRDPSPAAATGPPRGPDRDPAAAQRSPR